MVLDKYIKISEAEIHSGQDSKTKEWYCKDLPAKTTKETKELIGELNKIYNEANKQLIKEEKKTVKTG